MSKITNVDINYTKATLDVLKKMYNSNISIVGDFNIVNDFLKSELKEYESINGNIEISLENGLTSTIKTLKELKKICKNKDIIESINIVVERVNDLRSDN